MKLGMFSMPLHQPSKDWARALREDREAVLLADELGFHEAWIGEHFSTKAEQIPSPMMFLASVIHETKSIKLGTGVVNLSHHHPAVVAAEAAQFDQMSGGRLLLGVGPGGLASDAEMFGHEDMVERGRMALEAITMMKRLWVEDGPLEINGEFWSVKLEKQIWNKHGIGLLTRPHQRPHPPIAMAMVSPGGRTAETIAENDFIPISANFVPVPDVASQWRTYAAKRRELGKPVDSDIWRVCRNILVTESDAQAEEIVAQEDGVFAFYFRYLKSTRRIEELSHLHDAPIAELDPVLGTRQAIEDCVIAGSAGTVVDRLVALVDEIGPFGHLVMVGHDWDKTDMWAKSMRMLAQDVLPRFAQHMDSLAPAAD